VFGKRSDDWLTTCLGVEVGKAVSSYKSRATRVAFSSRVGDPAHLPLVDAFEAASDGKSKVKILDVSSLATLVTLDEIGKRGRINRGRPAAEVPPRFRRGSAEVPQHPHDRTANRNRFFFFFFFF
jgi:hypothetical protein